MQYDKKQLTLPLSRDERLSLIDGVDPRRAGVHVRSWRTCRDMLKQIEFCSTGGDSSIRVDRLAARMAVNKSTVLRTADKLEAAGLLQIERERYDRSGRASNGWRIRWDRVIAVQRPDQARHGVAANEDRRGASASGKVRHGVAACKDRAGGTAGRESASVGEAQNATHPLRDATHLMRDATHPIRGFKSEEGSVRSTADEKKFKADDRGDEAIEGRAVRQLADRIVAKIGKCRSAGDWELAVKAASLSRRLGERWLWNAVEGVALLKPRRPWAYLHKSLATSTRDALGLSFNRLLKTTAVPPAAATWRGGDAWANQERLCETSKEPIA